MLESEGDIFIKIVCDECYQTITRKLDDRDLMYQSIESHAQDLMEENNWESDSLCPMCDTKEYDNEN